MGMATPEEMRQEENTKKGMQSTVEFLNGSIATLGEILGTFPQEDQQVIVKGMLAIPGTQPLSAP